MRVCRQLDDSHPRPHLWTREGEDEPDEDHDSISRRIKVLQERISRMGPVQTAAIGEWQEKRGVRDALVAEYAELDAQRQTARAQYESLKAQRHCDFLAGLRIISAHLRRTYSLLTAGGTADLDIVDSLDPFAEGVAFSVMPPRKAWRAIGNLSGGEKTLASLALVFALHAYRPCPLYVMDEIDAALDYRNVSIVAEFIRQSMNNAPASASPTNHSTRAQFLVISLRNDMFEAANQLVGVYKIANRTRSIAVDPLKLAQKVAASAVSS